VLGDIPNPQAIFQTNYKQSTLVDTSGQVVDANYRKTSPDHILVQGLTEQGVLSSFTVRKSKAPIDDAGIRWIISGTKGEVSITGPEMWQTLDKELHLHVRKGSEAPEEVEFDALRVDVADKVAPIGANVASMYHAFAKGDESKYATFESATKTHRLLDRIRKAAGV
jgi:predicted dehydrogenase